MMKFLFKTIFVTVFFASAFSTRLFAMHAQGGEITYTCVAPNVYLVTCKLYRDCVGTGVQPPLTLNLKPQSCAGGRTVLAPKTGLPISGDPFCAILGQNCTSSTFPVHLEEKFEATVTFTPAEAACPNWIVSFTENSRPEVANLINPQRGLYCEAFLNLASGINNNSPVINEVGPTVEHVCIGQETRLILTAFDPDCDSLSYELVAPLSAPGVAYAYDTLPGNLTGTIYNPNPIPPYHPVTNPQTAVIPVGTTFSPTFPIPSFTINWNQINPATGIPYPQVQATKSFKLDSVTGVISFRPAAYFPTPWIQGKNKYVVVVKINEWRKINGVITNVGSTRRDMLFVVNDCGGNSIPALQTLIANGQPVQSEDILIVRPGGQLNLQFTSNDVDIADTITLQSNVTSELAGSVFTQSAAAKPTGQITWTAPLTNFSCGIRYFYIRVRDNSCPVKGKQVYLIGVKVSNSGTATGIKEEFNANLDFKAYPNPFTETIYFTSENFRLAKEIRIYNLLGRQIDIIKVNSNKHEIRWENAPKFAAGTYVAKLITTDNSIQTLKFSKLQ